MNHGTMRAAVLRGPKSASVERVPRPEPGPGEVRLRVEGCGVCGSSLPVWEGRPWFDYPQSSGAPGHETWGVIDAVGEGVDAARRGERVTLLSYHGFAEYDVAAASTAVPLPAALDGRRFPGEAAGCAWNVFARSDVRAGQTVAIVGIGFLGALLTRLAAGAGARVIAVSRRPVALALARSLGASETLALGDHADVVRRVREATDGRGCERVVEAVGQQGPLDLATQLTAERGRLIIAGYHQDGPRQVDLQLWNWRGLDVVNAHERDPERYVDGMRAAVGAAARGEVDVPSLVTHAYPLDQVERALALVSERPDGFLKAVVTP